MKRHAEVLSSPLLNLHDDGAVLVVAEIILRQQVRARASASRLSLELTKGGYGRTPQSGDSRNDRGRPQNVKDRVAVVRSAMPKRSPGERGSEVPRLGSAAGVRLVPVPRRAVRRRRSSWWLVDPAEGLGRVLTSALQEACFRRGVHRMPRPESSSTTPAFNEKLQGWAAHFDAVPGGPAGRHLDRFDIAFSLECRQ
jgi:hypothetical protein